jgi:hypothetical protein
MLNIVCKLKNEVGNILHASAYFSTLVTCINNVKSTVSEFKNNAAYKYV